MKSTINAFLKCALVLFAHWGYSQAPSVEWQHSYWAKTYPASPMQPTPPSGFTGILPQNKSSEDWFYAHAMSKDSNNQPNGYICGGYSQFINYAEYDSTGCFLETPGPNIDCNELERPGYRKGGSKAILSLVDLNGNPVWYKTYASGAIANVIQTADGGYLALGSGKSCEDGQGNLVAYNPGQTPGHVSDYFLAGTAAPKGTNKNKLRLTKVDANGNVQWQYMYGIEPYSGTGSVAYALESRITGSAAGGGLIETSEGHFMFTASASDPAYPGVNRTCVIEVDNQGYWRWGKFYGPTDKHSFGSAITKTGTGTGQVFFISGSEETNGSGQRAFVLKIDNGSAPNPIWTAYYSRTSTSGFDGAKAGTALAINTAGQLLVPVTQNINGRWSGQTGEAFVYRVNTGTGSTIGFTNLGAIAAYDLTVGVTATADGGFAVASSKQLVVPPYFPATSTDGTCAYDYRTHVTCGGSDGYVAKCRADGTLDWDKIFDSNTNRPPGAPTSWTYPDVQMRDIRLQECLYTILQAPDGGFVVAGNNSENFDDCYLVKLESVCTDITLSNITFNTVDQSYIYTASNYITASTVIILAGQGKVHLKAGNAIGILPGFRSDMGSIFLAYADPALDCTPNGYRKGSTGESLISHTIPDKFDKSTLKIFPNPNNGIFTVQTNGEELKSIYVYNLMGDLIFENTAFSGHQLIVDITNHSKGLYFVKVVKNGVVKTGKIIHQ